MQHERLYELRKKFGLSQEQTADIFEVSRQSVQKWENGNAVPDIENLVKIARFYNVTTDYLLRKEDTRDVDSMRLTRIIEPQYDSLHTWELYSSTIMVDYIQSVDEGKDISAYKKLFEEIAILPASAEKEDFADILFKIISRAPQTAGYVYNEPSDIESIHKLRKKSDLLSSPNVTKEKIYGAWIGRICGCLLGKPIECISCAELNKLLKITGNSPMTRYITAAELTDDICSQFEFALRGRCYPDTISCAPPDDDTNYTVLGQRLIQKRGKNFTPKNVADLWLDSQPKNAYCTAERVAFRNFVNGYQPPFSAEYKNAYREWIGAQIRADYFGYINPGNTEAAAEMAWRDASISHIKNGIYGEMFVAAMLAAAYCTEDMRAIVLAGLGEIPSTSRLYENIMKIIENFDCGMSADDWFADFHTRWNDRNPHHWCHTISNAEIVTASLLYCRGDYSKSICMAVEGGFDTDCNGATVGSIVGLARGIDAIDPVWYASLNDTLDTSIFGVGKVNINSLADITLKHIEEK